MLAHGFDIAEHRAQQITESLLRSMDLILAIDRTHADWIVKNFPYFQGRVHKLGKWRGNLDIADPYGGPEAGYEEAYQLIDACIETWLPYLK